MLGVNSNPFSPQPFLVGRITPRLAMVWKNCGEVVGPGFIFPNLLRALQRNIHDRRGAFVTCRNAVDR